MFRSTEAQSENKNDRHGAAEYTRPATWEDLLQVARLMNKHKVRYVLVGGYALAAHGYARMTQDIDIAVSPDEENAERWIKALSELPDGAALELKGETDPFEGDILHAIRINDEFTVDVLPSVSGVPFSELEKHKIDLKVEDETIPVLDLKGLLKTKQGLRPKDRADADLLRRVIERIEKHE
ncbi:MAG: nucleotidyl transferase AbiEii/AbiGii toxin family protein [Pseudomonadota bacterium]